MSSRKIAIIGTGISGLTCAHLLSKTHDVSVFEANDYIGGHTHTVPVTVDGESFMIDTGFIVCNDRNYPNFLKLMEKLKVEVKPTEMSFSVRNPALKLEYNGHNLNTLFSQRLNLFRPSFHRLVRDILRFNKASRAAIEAGDIDTISLNEFIAQQHLSDAFSENYLLPMVAAIWSCSLTQAGEFPLAFFLRFFLNHGLLDIKNRPQWYVLSKGSSSYIEPMTAGLSDRIKLNSPVQRITRTETGVELEIAGAVQQFDEVIVACHSDQALALLDKPSAAETSILGDLGYQENDVILHMDASIMPKKSLSWASWNFLAGQTQNSEAPIVTYCMNVLQGIYSTRPFLVTLNARHKIDPAKILQEFRYDHPVYSQEAIIAQGRRREICGIDNVHYCGAYWYSGFHEDGVHSALDVCERFGASL
jgi:predicted NAD/FAD-binding protein